MLGKDWFFRIHNKGGDFGQIADGSFYVTFSKGRVIKEFQRAEETGELIQLREVVVPAAGYIMTVTFCEASGHCHGASRASVIFVHRWYDLIIFFVVI